MRDRLKTLYEKHGDILRYLIIGGLTTAIDYGAYALLTEALGVHIQVAGVIAWILAVSFAFVGNKWIVFQTRAEGSRALLREVAAFTASRLVTLGFQALFLYVAVDVLSWNNLISKAVCNVLVVVLNYVLGRLVVFRRK